MNRRLVRTDTGYVEYPVRKPSEEPDWPYYRWTSQEEDTVLYLDGTSHTYEIHDRTTIDRMNADIAIPGFPFRVMFQQDDLLIERQGQGLIFYNKQLLKEQEQLWLKLEEGDQILLDGVLVIWFRNQLVIFAEEASYETRLIGCLQREMEFEGFPRYKRSPRLLKKTPDKEIEIKNPPEENKMKKGSLIQMIVPPLMMVCVTAGMGILMKRGLYVLVSLVTTVMTTIFTVTKYFNEKKDCAEKEVKRKELYDNYLLTKRKELYEAREKEKEALSYNYPSLKEIECLVQNYSSRIYEKNPNDDDFLTISLGMVTESVDYGIKLEFNDLKLEKDELELEAKALKDEFGVIENKPVIIDLKRTHLGLVGEKEHIHEQLKLLAAQLTFSQSYHEVQIVNLFDAKYQDEFLWMNWYPHLKIRALNVCGSIYSERVRDQVLGSLVQILKERKLKLDEQKKESRFLPHFVFIIDEPKLIMDHSIMEYLDQNGAQLGFSIIYTTYLRANLPEYINTVFLLDDSEQGTLLMKERVVKNQKIRLEHTDGVDLGWIARNLSVLEHEQGVVSHIPESITFFDMYKIRHPQELQSNTRWQQNESHKTLAVPLGVRAEDDYVNLNLHEKAHGPHGLVAGTTGSGKSEIVQSYILSLAANFHPYEVGFLLIDYKGGGMAGLFKNLPHLLGTITNLDGSESLRAMASIKSELARRQRIFSANNVNHINSYNKLFKSGKVEEPIPHLFLISDEFAELKKEQPEFMSELVSTARIGRSLGIHLILATQKPSGVVDDQIWTNSKFKLALKVQNEADSREILKTSDAAGITQPGRAYLQVGNNEIYELFQSAWSGAVYQPEGTDEEVDNRVYLVNDLGQGELLNDDLSGPAETNQIKETQLDVTVDYLNELFANEGAAPVKHPWLPSLPYLMVSPLAENIEPLEHARYADLAFPLGMADIPEEQMQQEYLISLNEKGNVAYFGSSGFGKTTFLMTSALSLAMRNPVHMLNFYVLDFGNSGLIMLNGLSHTAEYMQMDDTEKLTKFIRLIQDELKQRKKMFTKQMAQNFDVYNQMADEPLKAIVVLIDNFDVVKELGLDVEDFFAKLSRDGVGLGIYMIITASKGQGVRYNTINNFKNKIAGFLFDESEAGSLVGRSSYKVPEIKGRALVHMFNINIMQIYTMVKFEDEMGYNKEIKALVEKISACYPGQRALRIPVLPEQFAFTMIDNYEKANNDFDVTLGLDVESVELKGIEPGQTPFVIVGESGKGKTNILKVILEQIVEDAEIFIIDSKAMNLYSYADEDVFYLPSADQLEEFSQELEEIIQDREEERTRMMEVEKGLMPKQCYAKMDKCYIVIDEMDDFVEKLGAKPERMLPLFKRAVGCGIYLIITVHSAKLKGFDELSRWVKTASDGLLVSDQGMLNMFPLRSPRENPAMGQGLLFKNGVYQRLLLPHCEV